MAHPPRRPRHSRAPRLAVAASAAAVTASLGPQPAQSQTFAPPVTNPFGLFDVDEFASPTFVDIDGDGDLDGFVGSHSGNTQFFENVGTPTDPNLAPKASVFSHVAGSFGSPTFADIEGDGDLDAFVSGAEDYGNGMYYGFTHFFENTGTAVRPFFTVAAPANGLPQRANMTFGDIDGDGDLDVFMGTGRPVLFNENIGMATEPRFSSTETNPWGIVPPTWSSWAPPAVVDIDGDGDLDLFIVGLIEPFPRPNSHVFFFENAGTPISPDFAAPTRDPFGLTDLDARQISFADIDGDGDLDAFIGEYSGNTAFFENVMTSVSVEPPGETAGAHALSAAFPNPFRERTRFRLEVSETQPVRVEVFDALGRIVEVPFDRVVAAGASQDVVCSMESWPAGVYVIRAHGPRFEATRTVVKQP